MTTHTIMIENVFKRLVEAGVTDVPKKYYDIIDGVDEYKVGFDSANGCAAIHVKTPVMDVADSHMWVQLAAFYPNGGWSAFLLSDEWAAKFVRLLEAAEAMVVKEFKGK